MGRNPRSSATVYFRVDQDGDTPLQQQIYTGIRDAILAGSLSPGARLPSSRALADELGVSRTTVVFALWQLQAEGCVVSAGASGTFVARTLPDDPHRPTRRRTRPKLSRIGTALLDAPRVVERVTGAPRPFRIGTPALDHFPVTVWARLAARRRRNTSITLLDYGTPGGYRPLREAIAAHVAVTRGIRCSPDQVLIMAGAQHALTYAARMLLDPGDQAWLEEPGYFGARSALTAAGASIVPVPVDAQGLNVAAGERLAPSARLAFVAPSHQHPLGVCLTLSRRLALLRWAARVGAWVIEDDYDGEFRYQGRPMPALFGLDNDGTVVYVGSFSKTIFPALRLGFMIVPESLVDPFIGARARFDCHPQTLDQVVLTDFITEGHYARHVRRMRHLYSERHDALRRAAARFCGDSLTFGESDTGLHVAAELNTVRNDTGAARAALERGIEVAPLSHYYYGPTARAGLVLGFAAVDPPRIIAGMRTLAEALCSVT
ncbi:MAG TPA: PLP-dependent aminotransferase family protein [Gemmatimonadaceae bacterium]|nr:PLP-dependent aminotransferase family protein [Gemmatimonadaceae bacterium]